VVQNTDNVPFRFLWFEFDWPLWIMLLVFAAVGAVVALGMALGVTRRRRTRKAKGDASGPFTRTAPCNLVDQTYSLVGSPDVRGQLPRVRTGTDGTPRRCASTLEPR